MGIEIGRIKIRVSSKDKDFLVCAYKAPKHLEFLIDIDESDDLICYRHHYGVSELLGRNINFSIKNKKIGEFKDIGNIIVIEKKGTPFAVEMGMGVSTLIAKIFSLENSIEASIISKAVPFKSGFTSKFSDALSIAVVMIREKIKPGSRDKARLLRTCLESITYFRFKLGISLEEIKNFVNKFEKEEFGEVTDISDKILFYLEDCERDL